MENESQAANRLWKEKPPGPEQLALEEMFHNGSITNYATPETVQRAHKLFKTFPARIFSAHFKKTKAKLGEYVTDVRGIPGGVIPADFSPSYGVGKISELGSCVSPPPAKRMRSEVSDRAEIVNPPFTSWTYTDHQSRTDYVCVAINIFSGSKKIKFDISEDGLTVIAKFTWPTVMIDPAIMFEAELKDNSISKHHPMVHAMSSNLLTCGITEDSAPEGHTVTIESSTGGVIVHNEQN